MSQKFFITHSWKDIEFARKLARDLQTNGLEGFLDAHSMNPGDSIPSRIERGLQECDVYIPVFSPDSLASDWCEWEIDLAITMNRTRKGHPRIIPVIARPCNVPDRLINLLYLNFVGSYDDALKDLLTKGFGLSSTSKTIETPRSATLLTLPPKPLQSVEQPPKPPPSRKRITTLRSWLVPVSIIAAIIVMVTVSAIFVAGSSTNLGVGSFKISPIDGATMVYVPAGEFFVGSSDADKDAQANEKPQHSVYLDAFWIDKFEVTNGLYKKCVDAKQCQPPNPTKSYTRDSYYGDSQFDNHPLIYVSWDDATKFCMWTSKKLPTEAQWEKAARGTDGRIYPWGNTFDASKLNSIESGKGDTNAVGSYLSGASPYGAMDIAGNVWEWVADWYGSYPSATQRNPMGPPSGSSRGVRGGSWSSSQYPVRAGARGDFALDYRFSSIGFRCVE